MVTAQMTLSFRWQGLARELYLLMLINTEEVYAPEYERKDKAYSILAFAKQFPK